MTPERSVQVEQPNLFHSRDLETASRLTDAFLAVLRDGLWHKGRDLAQALQTNERVLRQIASSSGGSVLSGQSGYRLTRAASNEEIDRCESWLRSQARKMIGRSIQIRKARNSGGVAA